MLPDEVVAARQVDGEVLQVEAEQALAQQVQAVQQEGFVNLRTEQSFGSFSPPTTVAPFRS